MPVQLPLNVHLSKPTHSFANYVPGRNSTVYHALQQVIARHGESNSIYIMGPVGSGKTHLLQAACEQITRQKATPVYLPLKSLREFSPNALMDGLETLDLVCLDDIQSIAGLLEWEQALFRVFNQLHELNIPLIISGSTTPNALGLELQDLTSRLSWGGVFALEPADEETSLQVLQQHAAGMGLELSDTVARYLLKKRATDLKTLLAWLEQLDYASLAAKRRLTMPFVRNVLEGN
ncbi:MAG: DnaA regulatory inactivator Hda [Pseudomonadota bacterium]